MFIDKATIKVQAGTGGNGAVSFHREKFVAAGGPDGGDGGRGGNVVLQGCESINTLIDFKYKRKFIAQNGQNGGTNRCFGKSAPDLVIKVPVGTVVKNAESGQVMADIVDETPVIIAHGGKGGWGNSHFATPTRQIPRYAKPGIPGESFDLILELKLLADVGLVGYPNVGKSTLISVVSGAKPVIANYHFTTLTPVLGVVKVAEEKSFVMADIPGLIEGASDGVGLGHEFLRHVERCRLIVHVVDVSGCEGRDPKEDFEAINRELTTSARSFRPENRSLLQIRAISRPKNRLRISKTLWRNRDASSSAFRLQPARESSHWFMQSPRSWMSCRQSNVLKSTMYRLCQIKMKTNGSLTLPWTKTAFMWSKQTGWLRYSAWSISRTRSRSVTSSEFSVRAESSIVWKRWASTKGILSAS